ncbi:ABC transporter ATP-binding protein [candidate division NPL-UPA2 bacterium Unc8]|uniref:ABC transporter ATP-binding protein n=1 Tax=candidate division NPL-UPA2 bacterium Unc8 TaxID=1980939 RepID=A0A399FY55_UNCN2|nr:Cobalt import ATP-binding protein CbiO [Bacillota bacterium]MBT9146509.1 Cobalt import ATP-binding protein CbiO [Bacillota bacterium]RII00396.1 MAG: ABC transporter ATP-binding protein [candidate division NPL-UPA2 bacterium Unc8]
MSERAISITNLSHTYPDGTPGLRGISLDIIRGESVGVIGPNGAGKTTLLLHLNGIFMSKNGNVEILGKEIRKENIKGIRRSVGLVFQDPNDQLFMPTVFDDVAFGPLNMGYSEAEVRQCVARALDWVGMTGYEPRSPHHLGVGEKKRIAIATVLAMTPEILVIDEPTANLDPGSKWSLIELLRGLSITKIIATHDLELVRVLCQRTIVLDKGRVITDGTTKHILVDKPLLCAHELAPPNAT